MKSNRKNYLIVLCCLVCICALFLFESSVKSRNSEKYMILNEGWNVEADDRQYENVDLRDLTLEQQNKGDVIRMSRTIPEITVGNPSMRIYTIHSDVSVRLGGEEIYSYGQDLRAEGKMLGYGYQYVELPDTYAGEEIEIVMHVTEDNAFNSVHAPEIYNGQQMFRDYITENRLPLAINLFLIVFGACLLVVSLMFVIRNKKFIKLSCVAMFSSGIGIWSICCYDLIGIFTYNLRAKSYLEFLSLYFCTFFVILYFWEDARNRKSRFIKTAYNIMVGCQSAFLIITVFLQVTNISHFPKVLKVEHMILFMLIVYSLGTMVYDIIQGNVRNKAMMIGMLIMMLIGLMDILRFNLEKYITIFHSMHFKSWMCVGALFFVIFQIVDFCLEITRALRETERVKTLEKMAYVDALTGTANRRKVEMEWERLDEMSNSYGMLSFDLNNLKKTNDTKGHEAGDFLIQKFAECLTTVYGEYGTVGRMGGDEFAVVLPDIENINIDELLNRMWEEIDKINKENPELNLSAAYGFCEKKSDNGQRSREIYREADARMYENKIQMKCCRSS